MLDWAAAQSAAVFDRIIVLCEDIGAAVTETIDWAIARGGDALEVIGGLWDRLGNSVFYALNYLENDFLPGIAKFVKGALAAGLELAKLVTWAAGRAFGVMLEVVRGALQAGATLADLVIETVRHPEQALNNLVKAARSLGQTMKGVVDAFKQAGDEFVDEFVRTMVALGENVKDMLVAVLEVVVGWLDSVVFHLMNWLNGFRRLTAAERADMALVFADAVDLDNAFIATESPTNSIIFGIQDFFTGEPNSRAFVTGNLINFDADDGPLERFTLVHEMTHVWQNQNVGPVYMGHAIFSQASLGDAAYNYGYTSGMADIHIPNARYDGTAVDLPQGDMTGAGAEAVLAAKAGDEFMDFNPEAQGQIMMHYFTRRVLLGQPAADYAAWEKFATFVQTHPQVH
jgi:hypothetical protein